MEVYFIRHGQTEGNRLHRHQFPETPLNELGHRQAAVVSDLVPAFGPTHLVTSTLTRARQTTAAIARTTKLEPVEHGALIEIQRPPHIQGLHYAHPKSIWYLVRWLLTGWSNFVTNGRGESYGSLISRIEESKRYLETFPPDAKILVVSHSVFINFFVAHICNDRPISFFSAFLRFAKIINLDNSSVTHVRFRPDAAPGTCAWEVVSFDNDAHVVK